MARAQACAPHCRMMLNVASVTMVVASCPKNTHLASSTLKAANNAEEAQLYPQKRSIYKRCAEL